MYAIGADLGARSDQLHYKRVRQKPDATVVVDGAAVYGMRMASTVC